MTVLMTMHFGASTNEIELSLTRFPERYTVSVTDADGLLYQRSFGFSDQSEAERDVACAEAIEWYHTVSDTVDTYIQTPSSQSIKSLVSLLN